MTSRPTVHVIFPRQEGRRSSGSGKRNDLALFPMRPMQIFVLGALVEREGWSAVTVDENLDALPTGRADLVFISVWTCLAPSAYQLADAYRAKGIPVVLGGVHPSIAPSEALRHADAVVIGEAEHVMSELLADAAAGALQSVYAGERPDMGEVPRLVEYRRHYTSGRYRRQPLHGLQVSRGCRFNCDFCSVIRMSGRSMRHLDPEVAVEELRELTRLPPHLPFPTAVSIHDDDMYSDPEFLAAFFEAVIRSGLRLQISTLTSIGFARDVELLRLAQRAGVSNVLVGIESISRDSLLEANKKNRPKEYKELIANLHRHKIAVTTNIIFGWDHDEPTIFDETVEFLDEIQTDNPKFTILTPLPGTATFARMHEQGRIISYDWGKYDLLHAVIRPERMTAEQLEAGWRRAHRLWHTGPRRAQTFVRHLRTLTPALAGTTLLGSLTRSPERLMAQRATPSYEADPADIEAILAVSRVPANDALTRAAAGVAGRPGAAGSTTGVASPVQLLRRTQSAALARSSRT